MTDCSCCMRLKTGSPFEKCYRLSKGKCKNQFRKKTILKYVWNKVHSDESISNVDPVVVGCLCKSTDVNICVWVGVYDSLIIYDQDFTQAILILHLYLENLYKKYFLNTFQTYMYQMEGNNPHPSHFFFANRPFFISTQDATFKSHFFGKSTPFPFL